MMMMMMIIIIIIIIKILILQRLRLFTKTVGSKNKMTSHRHFKGKCVRGEGGFCPE